MRGLPEWLRPVAQAVPRISGLDLTAFLPPPGHRGRRGAVLVLFGEGPAGPDLLLTERAHDMRSHPGQVSLPGGAIDPGEDARAAALREAEEETGLDPAGVEVFGVLPDLWLPPSRFVVTPVLGWWARPSPVRVVDPAEVHAIHQVPVAELLDPAHRISVRHPSGWMGPGFWIGDGKDVILWGFTARLISGLFDVVGWTREWDAAEVVELPSYMLRSSGTGLGPLTPGDELR